MSNELNIRWIEPSSYSMWGERRVRRQTHPLGEEDIIWIGTVSYRPRERKVVVRAIYRYNSLLITVKEKLKDRIYKNGKVIYTYDGNPFISISSSGLIRFNREPIGSLFKATEAALVKYIGEFMTVADLEKIKKKTMGKVDSSGPFWVM